VLVSWPFAKASAQINALGVMMTCQWLLGSSEVVDVEIDGGGIGKAHGLLIKRCRYLEESGCASVCINICKVPTQTYFREQLGVPLTMQPNYDDFSCLASFGKTPPPVSEDPVFANPCFNTCSSRKRQAHSLSGSGGEDAGKCHLVYEEPRQIPAGARVEQPIRQIDQGRAPPPPERTPPPPAPRPAAPPPQWPRQAVAPDIGGGFSYQTPTPPAPAPLQQRGGGYAVPPRQPSRGDAPRASGRPDAVRDRGDGPGDGSDPSMFVRY